MRAGLLEPGRTVLVLVDLQERFAPAIEGWQQIVERAAILARAATLIDVPVVVTEQYPKGLGPTVGPIAEALPGFEPLVKTSFPATGAEGFDLGGRDQAVLCGVETHVCVQQSALELLDRGVAVQLAVDATGSRHAVDRDAALSRMEMAGVVPTTAEAVGFELLRSADADGFREFQGMIR